MLSPFDAVGAMLDGAAQPFGAREEVNDLRRYTLTVDLPPGTERTVIFDLTGDVDAGPSYRLRWFNQPLPNDESRRSSCGCRQATFPDGSESGRVIVGDRLVEDLTSASTSRMKRMRCSCADNDTKVSVRCWTSWRVKSVQNGPWRTVGRRCVQPMTRLLDARGERCCWRSAQLGALAERNG